MDGVIGHIVRRIGRALDAAIVVLAIGGGARLTIAAIQFGLSPVTPAVVPRELARPVSPPLSGPAPLRRGPDGCARPIEPASASIRWIEITRASKRYEMDRMILSELSDALVRRRIEIQPAVLGGRAIGFRLGYVGPDDPVAAAGFQTGDIVERVNGFSLASPDKILRAYAQLTHAHQFVFDVVRAGCPMSIDWTLLAVASTLPGLSATPAADDQEGRHGGEDRRSGRAR